MNTYDFIGDIHGYAKTLELLLQKLGYTNTQGFYQHPTPNRRVIFLGDLIDRGPRQKQTVDIVRRMVQAKQAYCIMGNHEFNAVCYHSKLQDYSTIETRQYKPNQQFLRVHSNKNNHQHQAFLDEFQSEQERMECIEWFKTLPLWIEVPNQFRVIHACWHQASIDSLLRQSVLNDDHTIKDDQWHLFALKPRQQSTEVDPYLALENLLKGPEIKVDGVSYYDKQHQCTRNMLRLKWWKNDADTLLDIVASIHDPDVRIQLAQVDLQHLDQKSKEARVYFTYDDSIPLFFGHYWRTDLTYQAHVACLDLSVAKTNFVGQLASYHWQGEKQIKKEHFTLQSRVE